MGKRRHLEIIKRYLKKVPPVVYVLAVILIVSGNIMPQMFSTINIVNLLYLSSVIGIVAIGMSIIMIGGGLDLSAGGVLPLSGVVFAILLKSGASIAISILLGILVGIICGIISGTFVAFTKNNPIIVTFAVQAVAGGIAIALSDGKPIGDLPDLIKAVGKERFLEIPVLFYIMIAILLLIYIFLKYTRLGSNIYSVGGNAQVAYLAGIRVNFVIVLIYALGGMLFSIGGVLMTVRMYSASPLAGANYHFSAITAAVVGGMSFHGGKGSVVNTIFGVFVMACLSNILDMLGANSSVQMIATGAIIVTALVISAKTGKRVR